MISTPIGTVGIADEDAGRLVPFLLRVCSRGLAGNRGCRANELLARAHDAAIALQGVQKEAQGGQRATVDVLNAQQDLISAKARLIGAQRDRVIASYTLLSAVGRLDVKTLNLSTPDYLPEVHYQQVRDAWHGLRTPSGQ